MLGDIMGGIADYYGNKAKLDEVRAGINAQMDSNKKANEIGQGYYGMLEQGYAPEAGMYGEDLARQRAEAGKAPTSMGDFDTSKYNINAYLDPSMAFQQKQAADSISQSAAARGGMFAGTGGTAKALQDRAVQLAQTDYANANQRMAQDRDFGYGQFTDKYKSQREVEDAKLARLTGMLDRTGTARQSLYDARGGAADLSMGTERTAGDLTAGKHRAAGEMYQATGRSVGNISRTAGDKAEKSLTSYFTGGK
jgi:hypothetical protein